MEQIHVWPASGRRRQADQPLIPPARVEALLICGRAANSEEVLERPGDARAVRLQGAVNVLETLPEATSRRPGLLLVVAGNWLRIDAGTVNVFCPAVVRQMKVDELVTALLPVPDVVEVEPMISTRSEALPPVQLRVSPALRVTDGGQAARNGERRGQSRARY